jgi:hypothetical protein
MARTLYRIYLYLVCVVLLGFSAFSLSSLLSTLLLLTPLRGMYDTAPDTRAVVQTTVLAITAIVVSFGLGGVHYWLIRRDIAQEPDAARGVVRSLALNLVQAAAAIVTLYAGMAALGQVGLTQYGGVASNAAAALAAGAVFVLVQLERARSRPAPGAAIVLQRLHLYPLQTIVLFTVLGSWSAAVSGSVNALFVSTGALPSPCAGYPPAPVPANPGGTAASAPPCDYPGNLIGNWLSLAFAVGVLLLYIWLARDDLRSVLRQVMHGIGFVAGLGSLVYGVERVVEYGLRVALGVDAFGATSFTSGYDFVPALIFGAVVLAGYGSQFLRESASAPMGPQGTRLTLLTISVIGLGLVFYTAIVLLLQAGLESVVPGGSRPNNAQWAFAVGLLVAGAAHPVLAEVLRRRSVAPAPTLPRRALILAGLAAGALAAAIGGATALYLVITAALGSPVGSAWAPQARGAAMIVVVGAYVAGVHLTALLAERKAAAAAPVAAPAVTAPAAAPGGEVAPGPKPERDAVDTILDGLQSGALTRAAAAARLRALIAAGPHP